VSVTLNLCRVILTNTGCCLLEVNIDSDRLDVIERVFLVEGKTEIALVVDSGSRDVSTFVFIFFNIVRGRTNLDFGVTSVHVICQQEPFCLALELLVN
jgi:hypothetical protein